MALEAIKGEKTINQISSQYEIHPTQIQKWKSVVKENLPGLFSDNRSKCKELIEKDKIIADLYRIIGQRDIEIEWLKKKLQFEP